MKVKLFHNSAGVEHDCDQLLVTTDGGRPLAVVMQEGPQAFQVSTVKDKDFERVMACLGVPPELRRVVKIDILDLKQEVKT